MSIKKFLDAAGLSILQKNQKEMLETAVNIIDQVKADIDSPNFIGTPTAPTPNFDDNSDQIATTAYVQNFLYNTILITITPATSGIKATLTNQDTSTVYEGLSDSSGQIKIVIKERGLYKIKYEDPKIKSIDLIDVSSLGSIYNIQAIYSVDAVYTVKIDLNNSNPLTCCEYQDDALGMTKGSSDWDNKSIFKDIRPCVFQYGTVNYYLDPNNFNHKEDGTDAILTGEDGDVMIEFNKFAYRIYKDEAENVMYVSITTDDSIVKADHRYHYYAFMRDTEGDVNHFYLGAFKGSIDGWNKLHSVAGVVPSSISMNDATGFAKKNGEGYGITNYHQLVALQCLYIIKYGNLNSQAALGNGYTDAQDIGITATGQTLDKGMYYGTTADSITQVKFAGIEDMWGNMAEWVADAATDSNWNFVVQAGGDTYTFPSGLVTASNGYTTQVIGTTEGGFMNIGHNGSGTTFFSDWGVFQSGQGLVSGDHYFSRDGGGIFSLNASMKPSTYLEWIGARLTYT